MAPHGLLRGLFGKSCHKTEAPDEYLYGLSILGGPDGQTCDPYSPDIIAIHGFNGHKEKTWTQLNNQLWLKDFLPAKLPKARIFTFGYGSGAFTDA